MLETCSDLKVANLAEKSWIEFYNTRNPESGFNHAPGGTHVPHPIKNPWNRPEYRKKMIPKLIAWTHTPQALANNKAALRTSESKEKRSAINKAIYARPGMREKSALIHTGISHDAETRARISAVVRARGVTPAARIAYDQRAVNARERVLNATHWDCRKHGTLLISMFYRREINGRYRLECRQCVADRAKR